ncbi:hypothetical protein AgCh_022515 [Apium graveolens]
MGKQYPAYRNNDRSRGLLWKIICALDYHHWQNNVRKMLPHKKHNKQKNAQNGKNPQIPAVNGAVEKLMDAEKSHVNVNQRTETSSTHKRSLKARIKALVAKMIRKEDDNKRTGLNFPAVLQLERTLSVKHLESSYDGYSKKNNEWRSPIIFFPKKATLGDTKLHHRARTMASNWNKFDLYTTESLMDYIEHHKLSQHYNFSEARESLNQAHANLLMQNALRHRLKEHVDVLELLQINEDLFEEYQQKTDVGKENDFQMPNNFNAKARLTKSGTFPAANLSYLRRKNYKPATLKDKQTEIWSFPRGVKLHEDCPETVVGSEVFVEDQRQRLDPQNIADKDDLAGNKADKYKLSCSSDSRVDQGPDRYIPSMGKKQVARLTSTDEDNWDLNSCNVTYGPINDLRSTFRHRRTSSLNDSLHRYARLFDYSFSVTTKWDLSKSTILTTEHDTSATGSAPISIKRNYSLPHGQSPWPNQDEDSLETLYKHGSSISALVGTTATEDNTLSDSEPLKHPVTKNSEKCLLLDKTKENLHCETIVEKVKCTQEEEHLDSSAMVNVCGTTALVNGHCEDILESTVEKSNSCKDLQVTFIDIEDDKGTLSVSSPLEFSVSEGLEQTSNHPHEQESSHNLLINPDMDFLSQPGCPEKLRNPSKYVKSHVDTHLQEDADADLYYVRDILKAANFNEKGFHGEWYSSEQPLSPMIFDEVEESWWPHESECSQENLLLLYHHQLLFDLINEVILQIYETSFPYYPRALSTSCQVNPLRETSNELEVLKNLHKYIGLKSELDQPLEEPVERDLAKADGWMSLQIDSECVALELDDLIFNELLEELICC